MRVLGISVAMYCQREGGQTMQDAFAVINPRETGPKLLESIE